MVFAHAAHAHAITQQPRQWPPQLERRSADRKKKTVSVQVRERERERGGSKQRGFWKPADKQHGFDLFSQSSGQGQTPALMSVTTKGTKLALSHVNFQGLEGRNNRDVTALLQTHPVTRHFSLGRGKDFESWNGAGREGRGHGGWGGLSFGRYAGGSSPPCVITPDGKYQQNSSSSKRRRKRTPSSWAGLCRSGVRLGRCIRPHRSPPPPEWRPGCRWSDAFRWN